MRTGRVGLVASAAFACVWFIVAAFAVAGVAGATINYLNIAVMCAFPVSQFPIGLMPASYRPIQFFRVADPPNRQLTGFQIAVERMIELGGIPIRDTVLLPRPVYFNIGPNRDPNSLQYLTSVMTNITTGQYGTNDRSDVDSGLYFPVIVGYERPEANVVATAMIAACERLANSSSSCVVIHPVQPTAEIYKCSTPRAAECVAKNRPAGYRRFDFGFSAQRSAEDMGVGFIQYIATYGSVRKVVVLKPNGLSPPAHLIAAAESVRMTARLVYYDPLTSVDAAIALLNNATLNFADLPDVIMFESSLASTTVDRTSCVNLLLALKRLDYMPSALYIQKECALDVSNDKEVAAEDLNRYVFFENIWSPDASGVDYRAVAAPDSIELFPATATKDSATVMAEYFNAGRMPNGTAGVAEALGVHVLSIIHKAIEVSASTTPSGRSIADGIRLLSLPSHYGRLQFDSLGMFNAPSLVAQVGADNAVQLLTPITQTLAGAAVFPSPKFSERVYTPSYISTATARTQALDTAIVTITTLCIAYVMVLLGIIFVNRRHNVIIAATPFFCYTVLLGAATLMATNYTWMSVYEDQATCTGKIWLIQFGWAMMMLSLIIKIVRVWIIVDGPQFEVPRIRLEHLLVALAIGLGFELVFTSIWQLAAPFYVVTVVIDPIRPSLNYRACEGTDSKLTFFFVAVGLCWKFFTLIVAAIGAARTRSVRSEFNESAHLGAAVWMNMCILAILIPVGVTTFTPGADVTREALEFGFTIRSIGILLFGISTSTCVFVPKILAIRSYPRNVPIAATQQSVVTNPAAIALAAAKRTDDVKPVPIGGAIGPATVDAPTLTAVQPMSGDEAGAAAAVPPAVPAAGGNKANDYAAGASNADSIIAAANAAAGAGSGTGASALSRLPSIGGAGAGGTDSTIDLDLRERNGLLERLLDEAIVRCPAALADLSSLRKRMPRSAAANSTLPLPPVATGALTIPSGPRNTSGPILRPARPEKWSNPSADGLPVANVSTRSGAALSSAIELSDVDEATVRGRTANPPLPGIGGGQLSTIDSGGSSGSSTDRSISPPVSVPVPQLVPISDASTGRAISVSQQQPAVAPAAASALPVSDTSLPGQLTSSGLSVSRSS